MEHRYRFPALCSSGEGQEKRGRKGGLRTLSAIAVVADVEDLDSALVAHALLVMHTTCSSLSEHDTHLTAVGNFHTKRHFPVWTDRSRISLSSEPETRKRDCAGVDHGGISN